MLTKLLGSRRSSILATVGGTDETLKAWSPGSLAFSSTRRIGETRPHAGAADALGSVAGDPRSQRAVARGGLCRRPHRHLARTVIQQDGNLDALLRMMEDEYVANSPTS
jgi:hypothetical protein